MTGADHFRHSKGLWKRV